MPFVLQLTDGTDTIDFLDEAFHVEDSGLQITPPEQVQTWTSPSDAGTGARLVDSRFGNRTITVTFHVGGEDRAAIRAGINRINTLLSKAIRHSLGRGTERVTLIYGWDGVDEVDHFEVFSGELQLPDEVLSVEMLHTTWGTSYRVRGCELTLTVSPQAYGLSPSTDALIQLPLSNRNGTNVTGGLAIKSLTDPYRSTTVNGVYLDSYVDINGAHILGDSPAQLRIEMRSLLTNPAHQQVVIGAHQKHAGQMVFHWMDTNMEMLITGSSRFVDYTVNQHIWRSGELHGSWYGDVWRIKLTNPSVYGAKKYRVMMCTGFYPYFFPMQTPMQLVVETTNGSVLYEGPIVEQHQITSANAMAMVLDLGVVQLPPFSPKISTPQSVYLKLRVLGSAGAAWAFSLGYVWLVPVESGYRYLRLPDQLQSYVVSEPTIVDDYWNGISYVTGWIDWSARMEQMSLAVVEGMYQPITLQPGVDHRIHFNFFGRHYIPQNTDNWLVRVFYSPVYSGAL